MNRKELEERMIDFAVAVAHLANQAPSGTSAKFYAGQMIRSSGSSALNYGEAQAGESIKDFIHKNKIVLKELRETLICLKIAERAKLYKSEEEVKSAIKENNELISIFVATIKTAHKNSANK